MKKTRWFPQAVKPVRVGVYERDHGGFTAYSKWDGKQWRMFFHTPERAAKEKDPSLQQHRPWRGLTRKAAKA